MKNQIVFQDRLFEVKDPFGKKIRTTKTYWQKLTIFKHPEAVLTINEVKQTIDKPDIIYQGKKKKTLKFVKKLKTQKFIVVIRHLNGDGFIITSYKSTKKIFKGEILWQK